MWEYNTNELYHYGVPGMRWGQRKASYATEKAAYKSAKKDYRSTVRSARKSVGIGFGTKGIARVQKAQNRIDEAYLNTVDAKAKYKSAKAKNSTKAELAEFKTYRKQMQKTGLAGSAADTHSGGKSTQLYNHLKTTKGKDYADKVQKKVQNVAVTQFCVGATVAVGSSVVQAYMMNKH